MWQSKISLPPELLYREAAGFDCFAFMFLAFVVFAFFCVKLSHEVSDDPFACTSRRLFLIQ